MRKFFVICLIVLAIVSLAIPAMAGRGNPETERSGEQSGQSKQGGPGGPNYGNPTPPPPEVIPTPTAPKSAGTVYRVYLPSVSKCASVQVSDSGQLSGIWK